MVKRYFISHVSSLRRVHTLSGEATLSFSFLPLFSMGVNSNGKNLILQKQILFFRSDPSKKSFDILEQCSAEAAFLRHCRKNFENDAAKTVPEGHLGHIDFWPGARL